MKNPALALSALDREYPESSSRERAEAALLRSVALFRLEKPDESHASLSEAHIYSISSADLILEAEVEYYRGLTALGENQLDESAEACERGLALLMQPVLIRPDEGIVPAQHMEGRLLELLCVVASTKGKYRESLAYARSSLAAFDSSLIVDVFQTAFALRNLAVLARDFALLDDKDALAPRISRLAWTSEIRHVEFATVEAFGWCAALHGDEIDALRQFRRAMEVAHSVPQRVTIDVNRALLARESGHTGMLFEELEHAVMAAAAYDWEKAVGDERYALLSLAQVAAPNVTRDARILLDRYTSIRNAVDHMYAGRIEPRIRAEEAYTHGLVLRAEGRTAASLERLAAAFETWAAIGFEWRAASAALELAELDAGDVFRLAVRRELIARPNSVFAERLRLAA